MWTIAQDGTLYGLDPATGSVRRQASIGRPDNHFPTPAVGDGLLLAPSADRVVAFAATAAGSPTTVPPPTTTSPARAHPVGADAGGLPAGAIAGVALAGAVALGLSAWLLGRRRGRLRGPDG